MRVEGEPILAVLGAINEDLVVAGAPLPRAGETVTGGAFAQHHGGKGGNQAVAAARLLGRDTVALIGVVGHDPLGLSALEALRADGVRTDHVLMTGSAATGVALIAIDASGENQISVAPGANSTIDPDDVRDMLEELRPRMVLVSLEVSEPAVRAAAEWSRDHDVPVIVNPAPFQTWVRELLPMTTFLTPNEGEFAELGDVPAGVTVIETRGANGARIHSDSGVEDVPTIAVNAADTTGAGDCFNGVLAAGLVSGRPLHEAVREAAIAAALSVRVAGAREGMPTLDELRGAIG